MKLYPGRAGRAIWLAQAPNHLAVGPPRRTVSSAGVALAARLPVRCVLPRYLADFDKVYEDLAQHIEESQHPPARLISGSNHDE